MPFNAALERIRATLADCFFFQRWQGVVRTSEEAAKLVFFEGLPPVFVDQQDYTREQIQGLRPFVIAYVETWTGTTKASPNAFTSNGVISLTFDQNVTAALERDVAGSVLDFQGFLANVITTGDNDKPGLFELSRLDGTGLYLNITEISLFEIHRVDKSMIEAEGDYVQGTITVSWGTQS